MKKITKISFQSFIYALIICVFSSCFKEKDPNAPKANFSITVEGKAPHAQVSIVNLSKNADAYYWSFSEGCQYQTYELSSPGNFYVDKAGIFTVQLTVKKNGKSHSLREDVYIDGENAILTYKDIPFSMLPELGSMRLFSTSTGEFFADYDVNESNAEVIDLAFENQGFISMLFCSPSSPLLSVKIPKARNTKIQDWESNFGLSVIKFDNMKDNSALKAMTITDESSLSKTWLLPKLFLFENDHGLKGAIKVTEVGFERIICTIKVQKYVDEIEDEDEDEDEDDYEGDNEDEDYYEDSEDEW